MFSTSTTYTKCQTAYRANNLLAFSTCSEALKAIANLGPQTTISHPEIFLQRVEMMNCEEKRIGDQSQIKPSTCENFTISKDDFVRELQKALSKK